MSETSKDRNQPSAVTKYAVILAVGWTLIVGASMAWNCISEKDTQIYSASEAARDQIAMDVLYRRWNASLGGVYVPVSDSCQPNPYLVDVEGRDIETPSGLHLTLVNPSYMTRQVHELGLLADGVRGHITSLKPLRPENAADDWEKRALESFEQSESEFSSVEELDGKEYLRLMRPLLTEKSCLKCHAKQGYKEGDVRGGISVTMPMARFEAIAQEDMAAIGLGHGALWLLGLVVLVLGARSAGIREQRRRAAEDALIASEDRFRHLFENAPLGYQSLDENGNFIDVNEAWCMALGYTKEEVLGKNFAEFLHPDFRKVFKENFPKFKSLGQILGIEFEMIKKDGTEIIVAFDGRISYENDGSFKQTHCVFKDITASKRAEEALRENQARLDLALRSANMGVWYIDIEAGKRGFDDQTCRLLGLDPRKFKGTTEEFYRVVHPDDRENIKIAISRSIEQKTLYDVEYRCVWPDGTIHHMNGRGMPLYGEDGLPKKLSGILWDITERKEMESRIREQGDKYRGIFDESIAAIYIFNKEKKFIDSNQAGLDLLGYSREELLSLSIPDVDADVMVVLPAHQQLLSGDRIVNFEHRLVRKDGKVVTVLNNSRPLTDSNDVVIGMQSTLVDITLRKQAEEALRQSEERLRDITFSLAEWVWEVDEKGVYNYSSQQSFDILGRSPEEVIGKTPFDFMPADEAQRVAPIFAEIVAKKAPIRDLENWNIARDGKRICLLTSGVPILDSRGSLIGYRGVDKDITERKRAEGALRESEARLFELASQVPGAVYQFYSRPNGEFGFYYISDKSEQIVGLEPELDGFLERFVTLILPPYQESFLASMEKAISECSEWNFEGMLQKPSGEDIWFSVQSRPLRRESEVIFSGIVFDITERKRAAEALRESEETHAEAQRIAHLGHWRLDLTTNRLDWSAEVFRIFAIDPKNFAASYEAFLDTIHPEDRALVDQAYTDSLKSRKPYDIVHRLLIKDGTVKFVHECCETRYDEAGNPLFSLGTVLDITERRRAEEALRESEEWFRLITSNSPDHLLVQDLELRYLHVVNPQLGLTEQDMLGKTDYDFLTKDDADRLTNLKKQVIETGEPVHVEVPLISLNGERESFDGTYVPRFNADGKIEGLIGYFKNVTERRRAEEALRVSENRYHKLFNSTLEGLGVVDKDEIIEYCNQAYADIFEAGTQDDLIGRSLLDFIPQELKGKILDQTDLRKQGLNSQYEIEIVTANGNRKTILASISPRFDDAGNYCGASGAIIDISETKRLQELESRALRLETAGQIAGQVAHDFNNMLAPMMAYPELIKEQLPVGDPSRKYLEAIEESAKRIADLNQQLLTLSCRGHYNQEALNLNDIIRQVLRDMAPSPGTLVIESDLCANLMNIEGGVAQMHRVVMNLVMNARDAVRDIGRVSVKTENAFLDDTTVMYGRIPRGEYIKLTVSDSGCGIPDEVMQKIFDPFFTTKSTDKKRGSGLGLSVVDAVVKDHNGYIDLKTTVGVGTSFYLYFSVTLAAVSEKPPDEIPRGTESILVVDDDEIQREVSARLLSTLGYEVTVCKSGKTAVELLAQSSFDLLVLDMIMPNDICGTETYRRALRVRPDQKAIIVSGFSESGRVAEAQKLGAGAFVKKPLSRRTLALAVRKELDRKIEVPSCT